MLIEYLSNLSDTSIIPFKFIFFIFILFNLIFFAILRGKILSKEGQNHFILECYVSCQIRHLTWLYGVPNVLLSQKPTQEFRKYKTVHIPLTQKPLQSLCSCKSGFFVQYEDFERLNINSELRTHFRQFFVEFTLLDQRNGLLHDVTASVLGNLTFGQLLLLFSSLGFANPLDSLDPLALSCLSLLLPGLISLGL